MRSMRRVVIVLAELMQVVSLLAWTFGGAWMGGYLFDFAVEHGYLATALANDNLRIAAHITGGIVGFAVAATGAAIVFAFAQIELNTRDIARYYIERRRSEAAITRAMK